jgi:hypothetical protein
MLKDLLEIGAVAAVLVVLVAASTFVTFALTGAGVVA